MWHVMWFSYFFSVEMTSFNMCTIFATMLSYFYSHAFKTGKELRVTFGTKTRTIFTKKIKRIGNKRIFDLHEYEISLDCNSSWFAFIPGKKETHFVFDFIIVLFTVTEIWARYYDGPKYDLQISVSSRNHQNTRLSPQSSEHRESGPTGKVENVRGRTENRTLMAVPLHRICE